MPAPPSDFGFASLLPPLIALALALLTKRVLVSLALGVLGGFVLLAGGDPLTGLLDALQRGVFDQLGSRSHASLIVLILIIGGFVGVLEKSGGLLAFAARIAGWVRGPVGAQLAAWMSGIAIFFSDSATPLIVGPIFRPVLERCGVSREKLAYILDSTASPVCVLVPFISWGVYVMSLFDQAHRQLGVRAESFDTFVSLFSLQLYPVLALVAVPLTIVMRRELGPMAAAQRRLAEGITAPAFDNGSEDTAGEAEPAVGCASSEEAGAAADADADAVPSTPLGVVVVPMLALAAIAAALLTRASVVEGKLSGQALKTSLAVAYLVASALAIELCARARALTRGDGVAAFRGGVQSMLVIPLILIFAWSLSFTCKKLGTGRYLARLTRGALTPALLAPAIFVVAAVISFAMGSAWGTYAILMPIAASLAHRMHVSAHPAYAAVLSGGLFGDHASPISDTTILASMGADCSHIDHVRTQLPYALVAALVSVGGFALAGRGAGPWLMPACIAALVLLLGALLWRFGQRI